MKQSLEITLSKRLTMTTVTSEDLAPVSMRWQITVTSLAVELYP